MDYTHLGRTGLPVSRLCLGTMNFGPVTDITDSHAIMDRAHEHGINFFDTANVYGWKKGEGLTEQIIGRWFAQGGGRREKTVLATKLYGDMGDWPNDGKLSALNIRRACDASLKRLQTDYIDLYQMHHVDRTTPWDEIWEAMEVLVTQGKVLYVGSSNFAGWHIAQAQETARARHFHGLVSEQSLYNLLDPRRRARGAAGLPGLRPRRHPVEPAARRPARRHHPQEREGHRPGPRAAAPATRSKQPARGRGVRSVLRRARRGPGDVALAWLLHQPAVTAPIIGPRTIDQLDGALRALTISLDEKALARLDEIWPGPGGTAPEAYAW